MWEQSTHVPGLCLSQQNNVSGLEGKYLTSNFLFIYSNLEGDLFLKNGKLAGMANLARTIPTSLNYENGVVHVKTGLAVTSLEAPFETSTSVTISDNFKPEVKAILEKIGFECGIEIPIKSGSSTDGQ